MKKIPGFEPHDLGTLEILSDFPPIAEQGCVIRTSDLADYMRAASIANEAAGAELYTVTVTEDQTFNGSPVAEEHARIILLGSWLGRQDTDTALFWDTLRALTQDSSTKSDS